MGPILVRGLLSTPCSLGKVCRGLAGLPGSPHREPQPRQFRFRSQTSPDLCRASRFTERFSHSHSCRLPSPQTCVKLTVFSHFTFNETETAVIRGISTVTQVIRQSPPLAPVLCFFSLVVLLCAQSLNRGLVISAGQ